MEIQKTTLSSTKAEYMAGKEASKVAIWLRRLYNEIGGMVQATAQLLTQSSMKLVKSPIHHDRTKHNDLLRIMLSP